MSTSEEQLDALHGQIEADAQLFYEEQEKWAAAYVKQSAEAIDTKILALLDCDSYRVWAESVMQAMAESKRRGTAVQSVIAHLTSNKTKEHTWPRFDPIIFFD